MAETVIEKPSCASCGTVVREGASFCYSCGEPVPVSQLKNKAKRPRKGSRNGRPFKEADPVVVEDPIVAEERGAEEMPLVAEPAEPDPVEVAEDPIAEANPADVEPAVEDRAKLPSAASLRRRTRTFERKPVEVVWVEREKPSMTFIIVSLVVVVLTAVLLALALYLR